MKTFSKAWKASVQPRKQRKYAYNAPIHTSGNFLSAHLSKSLRKEFARRSARVVKGDKVKVLRGSFADVTGEVLRVDAKNERVYLKEASRKKVAGGEKQVGIHPSNIMIIELETKGQKRMGAFKRGKGTASQSAKAEKKEQPKKE